jgi:GT2 family glycosyltransferase
MVFDISVIIINYNSESHTINCINSFFKYTSKKLSCQYLIVDNASQKSSFIILKEFIDSLPKNINIELIRSNINTGFGGGNMIGFEKAKGKYLAFVNNDTFLKDDCLFILKEFIESRSDVGICSPQSFKENGEMIPTIDHFASLGREIFGRKFLEIMNPKKYPKRSILYKVPKRGQFVAGSFMFFLANDFKKINGFDTNIFLYYEETDICKRLLKIKKFAFIIPKARYVHYHGISTPKSIAIKTELKISLLYVIKKHYGKASFYVLLNYLRIRYFFSSIIKPKYWSLFYILVLGAPLSKSLKHKQKLELIND